MKRWHSFLGFFFHLIVNDILKQTNKYARRFARHNLFDANRHLLLKRYGWYASPKPLLLTQIHICYSPAGRSVSRPLVHFFPIRTDLDFLVPSQIRLRSSRLASHSWAILPQVVMPQVKFTSGRLAYQNNMQTKEWKHTTWIKYSFTLLLFFMSTP